MMLRYPSIVSTLLAFMSCSEIPMTSDGTCNCPMPNAAQVSYSNTTSHLTSTNVQAAVDELAARPNEPPLGSRISVVLTNGNVSMAMQSAYAACPDETHDLAIGGACAGLETAITGVRGSNIDNRTAMNGGPTARYSCSFNLTGAGQVAVQVSCLRNVR